MPIFENEGLTGLLGRMARNQHLLLVHDEEFENADIDFTAIDMP